MHESNIRGEVLPASGEIPREQWNDFLTRFAVDHEGWIAFVEWPDAEELESAEDLLRDDVNYVLEGIDSDIEATSGRISISLSNRRTILLDEPARIERHPPNGHSEELLKFEASGVTCNLHLRYPEIGESFDTWL